MEHPVHVTYLKAFVNLKSTLNFQVSNAEQFHLPAELDPHENLPFSWKWSDDNIGGDSNSSSKICANCSKSSRGVPAIACDFCPNIFHLDCLDPPLAEIPRVRNPNLQGGPSGRGRQFVLLPKLKVPP